VARNRRLRFELARALRLPRTRRDPRRYRSRRAGASATTSWPGSPRALFRVPVRSFRATRGTAVRRPAAELQHCPGEEKRADAVRQRRRRDDDSEGQARDECGHRQAACRRSGSTAGLSVRGSDVTRESLVVAANGPLVAVWERRAVRLPLAAEASPREGGRGDALETDAAGVILIARAARLVDASGFVAAARA
jgi:hypothetical protein